MGQDRRVFARIGLGAHGGAHPARIDDADADGRAFDLVGPGLHQGLGARLGGGVHAPEGARVGGDAGGEMDSPTGEDD